MSAASSTTAAMSVSYPAILQFTTVPNIPPVDINQATLDDLPKTDTIKLSISPILTAHMIIDKIEKYVTMKCPGRCLGGPTELVYYAPLVANSNGGAQEGSLQIVIDLTSKLLEVPEIAARTVDAHISPRGNIRDDLIVSSENPIVLILRHSRPRYEGGNDGLVGDLLTPSFMDEINNMDIMESDAATYAERLLRESIAEIQENKSTIAPARVHWSERLPSKPSNTLLEETLKEEEEALEKHLKVLQDKTIQLRGSVAAKLEAIELTKASRIKIENELQKRAVDGESAGLTGAEIIEKRDELNREVNLLREEIAVQKAREVDRNKNARAIMERSKYDLLQYERAPSESLRMPAIEQIQMQPSYPNVNYQNPMPSQQPRSKYTVNTSMSPDNNNNNNLRIPDDRSITTYSRSPTVTKESEVNERESNYYYPQQTRSLSSRSTSKAVGDNPVQGHPRLPPDVANGHNNNNNNNINNNNNNNNNSHNTAIQQYKPQQSQQPQQENWAKVYEPPQPPPPRHMPDTQQYIHTPSPQQQQHYGVLVQPPPTIAVNNITENTWLSPTLKKQVDKALSSNTLPMPGYLTNPQYRTNTNETWRVGTARDRLIEQYGTASHDLLPRALDAHSSQQQERFTARSPERSKYTYDPVSAPPTTLASDLASYLSRLEGKNMGNGNANSDYVHNRRQGLLDKLNSRQMAQSQPFYPQPTNHYITAEGTRMGGPNQH